MRRSNTRFISGTIAVLACCVTAASLLSACRASDEDKPVITTEIKGIMVMSAEENSENIWYINWPGYYVAGNEYVKFEDKALELNEDETEFILSYMNSFPSDPENADDSECICRIWVTIVDEECRAYAEELAKALGATGGVTKGSSDFAGQEWYEINGYKDTVIRIYRTDIVSKDIRNSGGLVDVYYHCFTIYEPVDMGELEGGNQFDFVYSNDHKFAVCVTHEYSEQKDILYEAGLVVLTLD